MMGQLIYIFRTLMLIPLWHANTMPCQTLTLQVNILGV